MFEENRYLRELVGELGGHLRLVSEAFGVEVSQRGTEIRLSPEGPASAVVERILRQLYALVASGYPVHARDVGHAIRIVQIDPAADLHAYFSDTILVGRGSRPITPRTPNQRRYVHELRQHPIVFGVGPAGTGKTFLAVAVAVADLLKGDVRRIILTRPAVEAGEKLGFLPGDLVEKVNPYLRPLYDAMHEMVPAERIRALLDKRVIEVAPLAFMRGRTLQDAWVVLDEAQNTTTEQMKMFLTRLGENSKMAITGDDSQVDLPRGVRSGLSHALHVLDGVGRIGRVRFETVDVVRHSLVADVIEAYERDLRRRLDARPQDRP